MKDNENSHELKLDTCPKCQQPSAASQTAGDGQVYFACNSDACDFKALLSKQDMTKNQAKLAKIKAQLFSA